MHNKKTLKSIFSFSIITTLILQPNFNLLAAESVINIEEIIPEAASEISSKPTALSKKQMVVTANQFATEAGLKILKAGGTAVDAAIAAQLVLNVVEPQASGIGGGGFMVHYQKSAPSSKKIVTYDGRETAPALVKPSLFLDADGNARSFEDVLPGGKSVGVPGLLRMLEKAHKEHGKLPWATLFEPAIAIARDGFIMSERLYAVAEDAPHIKEFSKVSNYLYDGEKLKKPGTLIKNLELAETLSLIAKEGADAFYTGQIAEDIVTAVQNSPLNPGSLTEFDLANYKAIKRDPVCSNYHKYTICGMGAPSSGGITVLQALGILSNFDLANTLPQSAKAVHLISEATRLAFADRNLYLADGDVVDIPPALIMLDKKYLKSRARLIKDHESLESVSAGNICPQCIKKVQPDYPSTTHLSIADRYGNVVSMTSSIEHAFGSGLMVRGFLLNNQLTDFSFEPVKDSTLVANRVSANKRPRSSMAPMIILNGPKNNRQFYMAVGSPGGSRIIPFVLQSIIAALDWKLDVQESVSMPHHVILSDVIELEEGTSITSLAKTLEEYGHQTNSIPLTSGLNAIIYKNGTYYGASDPRREGIAMGE